MDHKQTMNGARPSVFSARSVAAAGIAALLAVTALAGRAAASPEAVAAALAMPGAWAYVDKTGKVRPSGSFIGVPSDSALTPRGLALRHAYDFTTDDPVLGCGAPGMPRALTAASPMTFAWRGDVLVIKYESMDVTRIVHMHRQMVPVGTPRSADGYSRGFWDGDTLVIETDRLDGRIQDLQGTPKSDAARLVERYRIDEQDGGRYLRLDLIMIDEKVFAKPYKWHFDFVLKPSWSLLKYDCQERPKSLTPGVVPGQADEGGAPATRPSAGAAAAGTQARPAAPAATAAQARPAPSAARPTSFAALDRNGDGQLTLEEFSKYPPATGPGRTPDRPFGLQDTNGDGLVSYREFAHRRGPRFASLDGDGDGLLTTRELAKLPRDMLAAIALDLLDRNHDRRLSVDEYAKSGPRWESLPNAAASQRAPAVR